MNTQQLLFTSEPSVQVLISCMHQTDHHIVEKSHVQSDCVVVNQCDEDKIEEYDFLNSTGMSCHVKFISTTERGLSKSRNMAIRNAWCDVCLICDDDETLVDNYVEIISAAYMEEPQASAITFSLIRNDGVERVYFGEKMSVGFAQILRTSSLQISFARNLVRSKSIFFDEKMGSGTGNGGGEENKFLLDIRRAKFKIYYFPNAIATINSSPSQWFHGYTEKFFRDMGWSSRRWGGFIVGYCYIWYFTISKHKIRSKDGVNFWQQLRFVHQGFFEKR